MNNKKGKGDGKSVIRGILFAKNIGKAVFIFLLLLLATTFVASAQPQPPCDRNVSCESVCCKGNNTEGWFYYPSWGYAKPSTNLFDLTIDGGKFDAYCINLQMVLDSGDTYNASIYLAAPSCKNNSIAYILNNWTQSCAHCTNVSAAQSAIWYFQYINDTFCRLVEPQYNHTATPSDPRWESRWIPNCTAHPEACTFINTSINKSVPYNVGITPNSRSFPMGTPIELEATVSYCDGEYREEVTVVFEANTCTFSENGSAVYENTTIDGKAKTTLICNASVDSVTVTAQVKDTKWFEIVDGTGCPDQDEYQETIKIVNITDDAHFSFSTHRVPALSQPSIIFLAVMMSVIAVAAIMRRGEKEK